MTNTLQETTQTSLLLLKPECTRIPQGRQRLITALNSLITVPLCTGIQYSLSIRQARELWWEDIKKYSWANNYITHMVSGSIWVFTLEGADTACRVKKALRRDFADEIKTITNQLNLGFQADLVHGSDPGQGPHEHAIITCMN